MLSIDKLPFYRQDFYHLLRTFPRIRSYGRSPLFAQPDFADQETGFPGQWNETVTPTLWVGTALQEPIGHWQQVKVSPGRTYYCMYPYVIGILEISSLTLWPYRVIARAIAFRISASVFCISDIAYLGCPIILIDFSIKIWQSKLKSNLGSRIEVL